MVNLIYAKYNIAYAYLSESEVRKHAAYSLGLVYKRTLTNSRVAAAPSVESNVT